MRIINRTKYRTLQPVERFLTEQSIRNIQEAAEKEFGSMYELTFAKFYACANGDFSSVLGNMADPTLLQVYWIKRFEKFVEEFAEQMKKLTLPPTPEEMQAEQGLLKTSWDESILVFAQSYFGLRSFKEVSETITIGEILIAKRAAYNREAYQRRLNAIQTAKLKRK